jgi:PhnB protein
MPVKPVPDGYHSITPYLICDGAAQAIDFYREVFGATEVMRMPAPGGRIGHAEIQIGDSKVMLADEHPEIGARSPKSIGGTAVGITLYLPGVDAVWKKALGAGATEVIPLQDKFYGDRMGTLRDPFGHLWYVATHVEDVSPEEMERRARAQHGA